MHGTNAWSLVRPIVDLAGRLGLERPAVLRRMRVASAGDHTRVPIDRVVDLWAECAHAMGDPRLPIAAGAAARLEDLHLMGLAILTAPTGHDALALAIRFAPLITDSGRWQADVADPHVKVRWVRDGERTLGHRIANENGVAQFVACLRQICGPRFAPSRVCFRHAAPPSHAAHRAHFRCAVEFAAAEDAFWFELRALDVSPAHANPALAAFVREHAEARLRGLTGSMAMQVRRAIEDALDRGERPAIETTAMALGSSERTLRRRLADEGVRFAALLDEIARARAQVLITQTTRSLTDVAFELGFADSSAFSHACRRWFGASPRSLRAARPPRAATGSRRTSGD